MTFNDIFKSNFLDNVSSVSILDMALGLVLAFGLGLFIFMVYKKTYSGVMYSASFGVSLIALAMITTLVILAVTSNVVLSLGMVGALSIVRFRSAIKEPIEIAFLFWTIAVGIVLGAGIIPLAVFGSVLIGITLLVFSSRKTHTMPYIAIIRFENQEIEAQIMQMLKANAEKTIIKNKTVAKGDIELHYEIRLKDDNTGFINALSELPGVSRAVLVSYNGDYMS